MNISEEKRVKIELDKESLKALQDAGIKDFLLAARSDDGNYTIHIIAQLNDSSASASVRIKLP